MKIKTSELEGAALDWAVAKCEQPGYEEWRLIRWIEQEFSPSTKWEQAGPLIDSMVKRGSSFGSSMQDGQAVCRDWTMNTAYMGETLLIAACRCFVASRLGDEVEIPEVLT